MGEADKWMDGYAFWKGQYSVRNTIYRMMQDELSKKERALYDSCNGDMTLRVVLIICLRSNLDLKNVIDEEFIGNKIDKNLFEEVKSLKNDIDLKFPYKSVDEYPIDIIKDICEDFFPPSMNDDCIVGRVDPNFRKTSVRYQGDDKYGKAIVSIDLNAETNVIIAEIRKFIEEQRQGDGSEYFADASDLIALKSELCSSGVMYRVGSDESRAVGLLLFDYLEENEASDAEAIRWARKEIANQGLKNFGKADSSDRQFQRWLSNTRRCIEFAEVFEI